MLICVAIWAEKSGDPVHLLKNTTMCTGSLPVPCEAMVSYYKKPGKKRRYVVVSMEILGKPQLIPE